LTVNGPASYPMAFQTAFLLIVAWSALACLPMAMTRETYCKPGA